MNYWILAVFDLLILGCNIYSIVIVDKFIHKEDSTNEINDIGKTVIIQQDQIKDIIIRLDAVEKKIEPDKAVGPNLPGIGNKQKDNTEWMKKYL